MLKGNFIMNFEPKRLIRIESVIAEICAYTNALYQCTRTKGLTVCHSMVLSKHSRSHDYSAKRSYIISFFFSLQFQMYRNERMAQVGTALQTAVDDWNEDEGDEEGRVLTAVRERRFFFIFLFCSDLFRLFTDFL